MTALECAQLKELWRERLEDFQTSGLSPRDWCAQEGLKTHRLHYWHRKLTPVGSADPRGSAVTWVTADALSAAAPMADALQVAVGPVTITVRPGFDPALLQRVVQALGSC
jgi:hypothetical protein